MSTRFCAAGGADGSAATLTAATATAKNRQRARMRAAYGHRRPGDERLNTMSIARRAAAVLAPDWLKQRHEAYSTGRYRERVRALTREFQRGHGLTVQRGPFAGLTYPESLTDADFLVPKLLGIYEQEVHDAIEGW